MNAWRHIRSPAEKMGAVPYFHEKVPVALFYPPNQWSLFPI
jgi:hypothetical protein